MKRMNMFLSGLVVGAIFALPVLYIGFKNNEQPPEITHPLNIVIKLPDPDPKVDFAQLECLAKNIYFEARGEPIEGQIAVSQVVLNRVNSPHFPNNICDVVYQGPISSWFLMEQNKVVPLRHKCQFSWWCDGLSDVPRDMWAWGRAMTIAAAVLRGETDDNTNGAMWYHSKTVLPVWANARYREDIGNHYFYTSVN